MADIFGFDDDLGASPERQDEMEHVGKMIFPLNVHESLKSAGGLKKSEKDWYHSFSVASSLRNPRLVPDVVAANYHATLYSNNHFSRAFAERNSRSLPSAVYLGRKGNVPGGREAGPLVCTVF